MNFYLMFLRCNYFRAVIRSQSLITLSELKSYPTFLSACRGVHGASGIRTRADPGLCPVCPAGLRYRLQEPVSGLRDNTPDKLASIFADFDYYFYFCELKVMHNTTMGLQNQLLLDLYKDKASVFTMQGIAMAYGQGLDRDTVKNRMIGYVRRGEILNPRKGIYAKPDYDEKELACLLYTPSYLSLEYVLQRAGIVFQYSDEITSVGNLSRSIEIDGKVYRYRKIKGEILVDTAGIIREGNVNIASPERAFLDTLYLDSNYYFDNPSSLDKEKVLSLLPIYNSKTLEQRVSKILG